MNDFYRFDEQDAYTFARAVGIRTKTIGSELVFSKCPYCDGMTSKKDKFYISLKTGQFQCFRSSCGAKGNMITLAKDFRGAGFSLGNDVNRYYGIETKRFKSYKLPEYKPKPKAIEYLQGRGISEAVIDKFRITTKKDSDNIIVFPFLDTDGLCKNIKYRKSDFDKTKDKNKEWFEKDCKPILFGMYQCDGTDRLIITEGQIDALSVAEAGINNAVSVPNGANGFSWIPYCWDWVTRFTEIIIFGDCEHNKVTLSDKIKERFKRNNIKVVRIKDYQGCKDANEILQKYGKRAVIDAVENAELVVSDKIIRAELVEAVDIENTPATSTGIRELDKVMSGGYRKGELVIVTGKRGDGKSTFVSQQVCNILNVPDSKVFMYSGELVNINVKRWLDMQLAGHKEIRSWETEQINKWYSGRLFFYDSTAIDDDECTEVLQIAEMAVTKYSCNFVVIDNLMSALDSGDADIYKLQARFAKKVAVFSRRYEVTVILIAHPRKGGGNRFDNDFISGSGDIANNANYIFNYQRIKDASDDLRALSVSKNRLTGRLAEGDKAIQVKYSENSRRIVSVKSDFKDLHYGWKSDNNETNEIDDFMVFDGDDDECPF